MSIREKLKRTFNNPHDPIGSGLRTMGLVFVLGFTVIWGISSSLG